MRIIQVTSRNSGEDLGLYRTDRSDINVEQDIETAFAEGLDQADDDVSPYDIADDLLQMRAIFRVFPDEVFITDY